MVVVYTLLEKKKKEEKKESADFLNHIISQFVAGGTCPYGTITA